nr:unnamed protein product [Digitaria exilis]
MTPSSDGSTTAATEAAAPPTDLSHGGALMRQQPSDQCAGSASTVSSVSYGCCPAVVVVRQEALRSPTRDGATEPSRSPARSTGTSSSVEPSGFTEPDLATPSPTPWFPGPDRSCDSGNRNAPGCA